jgi:hypothetical protein
VPCDGKFVAGTVDADAPPASDKDIPAIPNTGKAVFRRFRCKAFFTWAM